jgi:hypothetical protein
MLVADGLDGDGRADREPFCLEYTRAPGDPLCKWNVRIGPDTAPDVVAQGEFLYRQLSDAVHPGQRADSSLAGMATS